VNFGLTALSYVHMFTFDMVWKLV